jgi:aminoglycoside phosphotransferase (APT) family kinase protein
LDDHKNVLEQVTAVARRHGVDPDQVQEVPGGVANRAFALGEQLFLRMSRPGFENDLLKETQVVPAARSAGVLTPAIIDYDTTHDLVDAPYVVMQRVHGIEPVDVPPALAEQLARLHQLSHSPDSPDGLPAVPEDDFGDPWPMIDDLTTRGYLDPGTANWLADWFTRLSSHLERNTPKVLIHGDVAAHNLLAGPANDLCALIDWGDAAWAPRAMDFAKLPLEQVATLLPDYLRHTRSGHSEKGLAASVLWFHLHWALSKLPATPDPGQRHWTAPTASRLLGLLRFFAASPPAPWAGLT